MKHKRLAMSAALAMTALLSGCVCCKQNGEENPEITVVRTASPVRVDGRLDDAVWRQAPVFPLTRYLDDAQPERVAAKLRSAPDETGSFQVAVDDHYLYLAVRFRDTDIVDTGESDQTHLYRLADTAELFIKPADGRHYLELYLTPTGKKTSFIYAAPGRRGLTSEFDKPIMKGMKAAAQVHGTLNDLTDTDCCWTGEMAVPLDQLAELGIPFDEKNGWTMFVSRYNYSAGLPRMVLSSFPVLPARNFHLVEYYANVKIRPENEIEPQAAAGSADGGKNAGCPGPR